jgi:hypothetical protein
MCVQTASGSRCGETAGFEASMQAILDACQSEVTPAQSVAATAGTCAATSACKRAVQSLADAAGCCTMPLLRTIAAARAVPVAEAGVTAEQFRVEEAFTSTLAGCLPSVQASCKAGKVVKRAMRITNIRFSWANDASRRETFLAAVRGDIATAAGVARDSVSIIEIREGSVIVDFEIQGSSESETDNAIAILDAQIGTGTVSLLTTEQLADDDSQAAKVDASAALGLDSGTVGATAGASDSRLSSLFAAPIVLLLAASLSAQCPLSA